ncbi:MAG: hypothetical protein QM711_12420 [Micropruina sp.]|uniref:hypothetical protein n=1 Tax=Micropruina sp. TaxID=2737536 RepID=UPI0039E232E4
MVEPLSSNARQIRARPSDIQWVETPSPLISAILVERKDVVIGVVTNDPVLSVPLSLAARGGTSRKLSVTVSSLAS